MRIIQLTSENVKRLKAVNVKPPAGVVVVSGKNAQGKSSLLDSIMYALTGKKSMPGRPIHDGEKKARVAVDLGEIVVELVWTSNERSYLKVTPKEGEAFASPQEILNKLVGPLSFDPLLFLQQDGKKQVATLKELTGLNFTSLEQERAKAYQERTIVNRRITDLEGEIKGMKRPEGVRVEPITLQALLAEHAAAIKTRQENIGTRQDLADQTEERDHIKTEIERLENELTRQKGKLAAAEQIVENTTKQLDALTDPDVAGIEERIRSAETVNGIAKTWTDWEVKQKELTANQEKAEKLTGQIEELDAQQKKELADAKLPVVGLGFTEDGVTFNDLPLDQASQAEQLRVGLAIATALNPKVRIILIRTGSLLDSDNMKLLAEFAQEYDMQIWIERVEEGDVGIIIEDGEVKEIRE